MIWVPLKLRGEEDYMFLQKDMPMQHGPDFYLGWLMGVDGSMISNSGRNIRPSRVWSMIWEHGEVIHNNSRQLLMLLKSPCLKSFENITFEVKISSLERWWWEKLCNNQSFSVFINKE